MLDPATSAAANPSSTFHEIVSLISALVWPCLALFVLIRFRRWIADFLPVLTEKFRTVDTIEVLGVKLSAAKGMVQDAVNQPATMLEAKTSIPQEQVHNAQLLQQQFQSAGVDAGTALLSAQEQIELLASEYQAIRASMPSGAARTREMNRIMGSLRTLGFAGRPLLSKLTLSGKDGERLAAIAILQVSPDPAYFHWLLERFGLERPFIFFHAALAIRQAALDKRVTDLPAFREQVAATLKQVQGFAGGSPDQNTVTALQDALKFVDE